MSAPRALGPRMLMKQVPGLAEESDPHWGSLSPEITGHNPNPSFRTPHGPQPSSAPWMPSSWLDQLDVPARRLRSAVHSALVGENHRLDPVPKVELHQDPLDVGSDRRFLHDERAGDLAVRQAPGDELEYLPLARGQRLEPGRIGKLGGRLLGHAVDHPAGDRWREQRIADGDRVDGRDQLLWSCAFEEEPGCARPEGAEDVVVLLKRGENQDLGLRGSPWQLTGGRDPVEIAHA